MYDQRYLQRLEKSGRLSRYLKKHTTYKKFLSYASGECLDYGCGDLSFIMHANLKDTQQYHWTGYDINSEISKKAAGLNIDFFDEKKHLKQNYNLVVCDNVLEHLDDWRKMLHELLAIVADGGYIIFGVPGLKGYQHDLTHKSFITRFDVTREIEKTQFHLKEEFFYPINLRPLAFFGQSLTRHILFYFVLKKE